MFQSLVSSFNLVVMLYVIILFMTAAWKQNHYVLYDMWLVGLIEINLDHHRWFLVDLE